MTHLRWCLVLVAGLTLTSWDALAAEKSGDYKVSGEAGAEVVADNSSGLMWQKVFQGKQHWKQAHDYCGSLDYNSMADWRLPSRKELMSIVKYRLNNPASDFPEMPAEYFWSSTTSSESEGFAWGVNFRNGSLNNYDKASTQHTRCVRPN